MTIETTTTIDAMGISRETGAVHLIIFADQPWSAVYLAALEEKINTYLGFVEVGAIYVACPAARNRRLLIDVYSHHRPDDRTLIFFEHARAFLDSSHGIALRQLETCEGYRNEPPPRQVQAQRSRCS